MFQTSEKGFYCYDYKEKHECLGDNKGRKRIEFKPETLDKLYEYYRPPNKQLYIAEAAFYKGL